MFTRGGTLASEASPCRARHAQRAERSLGGQRGPGAEPLAGAEPPGKFLAKMGVFRGCESDFSSEIAVNSFDQNCN